jgi:hypothetical protein
MTTSIRSEKKTNPPLALIVWKRNGAKKYNAREIEAENPSSGEQYFGILRFGNIGILCHLL